MPPIKHYPTNAARQKAFRDREALARQKERQAKGLPMAPAIPTIPAEPRRSALIEHARSALHTARDEMQDYHADRTESWQQSDRAEAHLERIEMLDDLLEQLDSLPE